MKDFKDYLLIIAPPSILVVLKRILYLNSYYFRDKIDVNETITLVINKKDAWGVYFADKSYTDQLNYTNPNPNVLIVNFFQNPFYRKEKIKNILDFLKNNKELYG